MGGWMVCEHPNPQVPFGELILVTNWAVGAELVGFLALYPAWSGSVWLDHVGGCLHPDSRSLPASHQSLLGLCFFTWGS